MYFKTTLIRCALFFFLCIPLFLTQAFSQAAPVVTGELKKWHNVTLTFTGPSSSETATPNPFLDYRMVVIFSNGSKSYAIPGYFAADGNAANSSATSGDKWRVHFVPTATGQWTWEAYFHEGSQIALDTDLDNGTPVSFNGQTGTLTIGATDKTGRDLRGKGMLQYVGGHYLRFAETGEYFVKGGADSPENFLNYADFDNSANSGGFRKTWSPHVSDWQTGDPTWKNGLGKGIIGAINYLSSKGMNVFSFLTMNTNGDDKDVFPWIVNNGSNAPQDDRTRFDCSKLDQWEVVFDHADKKGMYLHFKLQEIENDRLLDDGQLGVERKVYYRELIARFGHHLALNWNLGEEYDAYISLNDSQQLLLRSFAQYIRDTDPYQHHIVVHTWPGQQNAVYTPMLGTSTELTGVSIQTNFNQVHQLTLEWRNKSVQAGKPWVVANDEQGSATTGVTPDGTGNNHTNIRRFTLWGNLMAGGAGVEYYFGYNYPQSDLTCEDFRSRDNMWDQTRYALDFFNTQLPFWQMANYNSLVSNFLNSNTNYCFAKPGETYVVYAPTSIPFLDLQNFNDTFDVQWFNPRTGGALQNGSIAFVVGPGFVNLGTPPSGSTGDWVALVKSRNVAPVLTPPVIDLSQPANGAQFFFNQNVSIAASASDPGGNVTQVQFFNGSALIQTVTAAPYTLNWTPPGPGAYQIKAVATDNDGLTARDSANITVLPNQPPVQQIAQPQPGASFNYNQLVQLTVTANDPDNGVSLVTFLVNGTVVQTFTAPPYTMDWVPGGPGSYSFKSVAADPLGLTDADSVSFTILPNQAPLVAFSQPANGDSFAYNQQVNLAATATDPDGLVDSVRFFQGGNLLQAFGAAPYSLVWSPSGPGVYTFYVTATDTSGLVATDSVTITVLPNQPPLLSFTQPLNGANTPFNQPVSVSVTASDPDGLVDSVRIFEGNTLLQAFGTGPYDLLWMPPTSGTYVIKAIATDNTGLATVDSVTFTVLPNQPPVAQFSSPANGTQATIGIPINLSATASDPDANLAGVFYTVNGTLVDSAFSSPFGVSWTPANLGLRTVIVTAFDSLGLTGADTIQVNVVANQPPVVSWQQPVNLTQVPLLQPVTLTANASDPDGTVTQVQFFVGGAPLFTDTQAPFTTTWTPVVSGNFSLVAIATDNQGETSNAVISVNVASNLNPLVDITQPLAGATLPQGQPVTVSASASDPDGTVAQVAYFVNGTLFQTVTSAPYTTSWTPASTGTFTLRAVVTDNLGATGVDSVAVTVVGNTPPIVVITTPINGFVAPMGIQVRFTATATDPNGTISKVEFFRNGVFFTLQQVAPYTAFWTPAAPGTYTIVAVGTDNQGATGSDTITVVVPNQPPVVDITQPANNTSRPVGLPFTISATASDPDGTVAQVAFFRGNVLISTDVGSPFSAVWNPSTPGPVQLIAVATDNFGATRSDTVNITVTANQSPVVAFTQPANGASLTINQPIAMNVTASDPDGSVVRVEFYNGTTLLNTDVSPPFAFNWTAPATGAYTLRAIAYDNVNNSATATVNVTVVANQPPTVALTQPSNLGPFLANRPINLQATASDTDGSVVSVTFLVNGAPILVDATSPYAATFTPTQPGNYTILARALDNNGATSSSSVVITVVPNPAPVVTITQPASNINVLTGTPVNVQFTVTDQDNNVTGIGLFRNGTQVQTFTGSGPYSHSWTPLTAGTYTYIAVATDAGANVSRDTVVVTATTPNIPPVVSFTTPSNNGTVFFLSSTPVQIAASDPDGTVTHVQLLLGNSVLATFNSAPYSYNWFPQGTGNFTLTARVTDNQGAQTNTSIQVTCVNSPAGPQITFLSPTPGQNVSINVPFLVRADVTIPTGTVNQVQFINAVGNTVLQTLTAPPYEFLWTPMALGQVNLRCRATGSNGLIAQEQVSFTVVNANLPPVVDITSPGNGGSVFFLNNTPIQVNASDPDGTIAQVQVFQGTSLIGTDATAPYQINWLPQAQGGFTLIARATDNSGLVTSDTIQVTSINNPAGPQIQIASPTSGQQLPLNLPHLIRANVTIPTGTVSQVQFINALGNQILQTFTAPPYEFMWTPTTMGPVNLRCRAVGSNGVITQQQVLFTVINAPASPVVEITSPGNGGNVFFLNNTSVQVNASDPDGTISKVDLFLGNSLIGTRTAVPYNFSWFPQGTGSYTLIARATDNSGLIASDTIQVVCINNPLGPQISFVSPLSGQNITLGAPFLVQANVTIPSGTVTQVQFINAFGNVVLQTFTSGPYQFLWTPSTPGLANLRCRAVGSNGIIAQEQVSIQVVNANLPPTVSFVSPTDGGNAFFLTNTNVEVSASDPDGTIAQVQLFQGTSLLGTRTSPPYNFSWFPQGIGPFTLIARAADGGGLTVSDTIVVNAVNNPAGPQAVFLSPTAGQNIPVNVPHLVRASVTIPTGTVNQVQFINALGNQVLQTFTAPPYEFTWTPTSVGPVNLRCRAVGSNGVITQQQVLFNVVNTPFEPTVNIVSPIQGGNVFFLTNTPVNVQASDPDGTVSQVQLFQGNSLLATRTAPPYDFNWFPQSTGTFMLIARATDNSGLVSRDTVIVTCINNPAGPQITYLSPAQGQTVSVGAPTLISANVSISSGTVTQVQFINAFGNVLLQTFTAPPYQFFWTPTTTGPVNIRCRAVGSNGLISQEQVMFSVAGSFTGGGSPTTETLDVLETGAITVFPNPASNHATLRLSSFLAVGGTAELVWYSLEGKIVDRISLEMIPGQRDIPLNLESFPAGSYLISLSQNGQKYLGRVVKTD